MQFLYSWGLFFANTISLVLGILVLVAGIIALSSKDKNKEKGTLIVKKMNEQFKHTIDTIQHITLTKTQLKKAQKLEHKQNKKLKVTDKTTAPKLFVIDFYGDIKASAVSSFRECITAILLTAKPQQDQILVRLESPGGTVNGYGLAASQLQRLRNANFNVTIAVDKVAASGGYMMACIGNTILSAPFAIIGSIGVVFQLPNFHRFLEKKAIDFEQLTAGDYKRTLTIFGENTKKDREKTQEDLNEIHDLFKKHILAHRSQVDIKQVATGEYWYGTRALELKLVDELKTSDDFILERNTQMDIYFIDYRIKERLGKKLAHSLSHLYAKLLQWNSYA